MSKKTTTGERTPILYLNFLIPAPLQIRLLISETEILKGKRERNHQTRWITTDLHLRVMATSITGLWSLRHFILAGIHCLHSLVSPFL